MIAGAKCNAGCKRLTFSWLIQADRLLIKFGSRDQLASVQASKMIADRWQGEDEDDAVKENWDDEDEPEEVPEPVVVPKKKTMKEKIAEREEKERLKREERQRERELRNKKMTPEELLAEKLERQKVRTLQVIKSYN